ncbi:helix-turn-helix domain-containing protein [Saccharomonospora xinjiangensis]|uniref:helix-turn-helix domain-containing protein n=1 Tax=Saccharomonospora xinjiangensis TaxID=75294 RepID=UPI001FFDB0B6|nr:helix-turn-helix domain-containing protein [Saccharomonospora xinjiangensis]
MQRRGGRAATGRHRHLAKEKMMSTSTLEERTVFPPDESQHREELGRLAAVLHAHTAGGCRADVARLVGPDGGEVALPGELYRLLLRVVDDLNNGFAVVIQPSNAVLTTQEAADLLHISRPTLVKLLERGEIPYHKIGRHRRVYLRDVLEYDERTRREREAALDEMALESAHDGTADRITGFISTR